jgi:hypothetical protein
MMTIKPSANIISMYVVVTLMCLLGVTLTHRPWYRPTPLVAMVARGKPK